MKYYLLLLLLISGSPVISLPLENIKKRSIGLDAAYIEAVIDAQGKIIVGTDSGIYILTPI